MRFLGVGKRSRPHENLEALDNEESMAQEDHAEVASDFSLHQAEDSSMNDLVRALTDQFQILIQRIREICPPSAWR